MKTLDLSIIIVNYNTKRLLQDCLESVFKNSQGLKIEVIVVDNGSADGSVEYLKKQKNVRLVENKKNFGFAKANNQGIKIAVGKYIFLLNSDTIIESKALSKLVKFAEKGKSIGGVAPRLLNSDGSIQASCFRFPSLRGAVEEFWFGKRGSFSKYFPETSQPVAVDAVVGAALLLPRETISKIGFLDERYFMYFEDFDYCQRIKKAGLKLYYLPGAVITHLHGASGRRMKNRPSQWLAESSKIYHGFLRHYLINFVIWSSQKFKRMRNKLCLFGVRKNTGE